MQATQPDSIQDPRPDIVVDSQYWQTLLALAKNQPGSDAADSTYGMLHCMRCHGTRLVRDQAYGFALRPGEWEVAGPYGYDAFRAKYLTARRSEVVALLKEAAELGKPVAAVSSIFQAQAVALGWTAADIRSLGKEVIAARDMFGPVKIIAIHPNHAVVRIKQHDGKVIEMEFQRGAGEVAPATAESAAPVPAQTSLQYNLDGSSNLPQANRNYSQL